ncbi:unnamed protein product [Urochloa humidicola]
MTPASNSLCSDHSYELPVRWNLLLLLDLLDVLRFVAGVLLDRLGVVSCEGGELELPGGDHAHDDAAVERFLEATATLWAPPGAPVTRTTRSRTAARCIRRRRPADEKLQGAEDGGDDDAAAAAVCAICLAGMEAGGGGCETVAELGACSHAFHAECIDAWAGAAEAATCPLCRAPLMLPAAWDDGRQSLCHAHPGD